LDSPSRKRLEIKILTHAKHFKNLLFAIAEEYQEDFLLDNVVFVTLTWESYELLTPYLSFLDIKEQPVAVNFI